MKAILEFNLPEEQEQFEHCKNGLEYHATLDDVRQYIRSKLKYTSPSEDSASMLEEIRSLINDR